MGVRVGDCEAVVTVPGRDQTMRARTDQMSPGPEKSSCGCLQWIFLELENTELWQCGDSWQDREGMIFPLESHYGSLGGWQTQSEPPALACHFARAPVGTGGLAQRL